MSTDDSAAKVEGGQAAGYERATVGASLRETMKYLNDARRDKTIVIRDQDKVSIHLLRLALVFAAIFIITPIIDPELRHITFASTIFADLLFCAALVWFVIRRFGVLRSMSKRHALICCQLMLGSGILVAVLALNLVAAIIFGMMGPKLLTLFSP